jgi:hypothetical protein
MLTPMKRWTMRELGEADLDGITYGKRPSKPKGGWKNAALRLVQLALFAWFMPGLFKTTTEVWGFDARLVMAALGAGVCAWFGGLLIFILLESFFGKSEYH